MQALLYNVTTNYNVILLLPIMKHSYSYLIAPPTLPQPPTAESLLSIIHPIASKWEEFGKALQIDEDRLDEFFTNNEHDQLRLRHMLEYYFMNVHFKHTWEEVIQALREIGEYECADKIVREKRLEGIHIIMID